MGLLARVQPATSVHLKMHAETSPRTRPWTFRQWLALYGTLALMFIFGTFLVALTLRGEKTWPQFWDALVLEGGVALMIAAVIAGTLEGYLRRTQQIEHLREHAQVEADVFRHLFGFGLDATIVDELTECVFHSKLLHTNLTLQYEFSSIPDSDEHVRLRATVSYDLTNTGMARTGHQVRHYFQTVLADHATAGAFLALKVETRDIRVVWTRPDLDSHTTRSGIRRSLVGPTITIEAGETASVRYSYETLRRRADSEGWVTEVPAAGLRLTVALLDPGVGNLAFAPDASHRVDPELVSDTLLSESRLDQWRISNGILPYQGVRLFWSVDGGQ